MAKFFKTILISTLAQSMSKWQHFKVGAPLKLLGARNRTLGTFCKKTALTFLRFPKLKHEGGLVAKFYIVGALGAIGRAT